MKILIVDDSTTIRVQLDRTLKESKKGFQVYEAENGVEALNVLKDNPDIKIVISDINMPEMDGITLAEFVKKNEALKNLEIVLLTTECSPKMKVKAKEAGVTAWIPKPAKPLLLLGIIEKIKVKMGLQNDPLPST